MEKALEVIRADLATLRTGRATPALVEDIFCLVYEGKQKLKLKELASIAVTNPQTLVVTPWDQAILGEIYRCLQAANLGLTPILEAGLIRLSLPPLSTERRQEYVKLLHTKLEAGRVMVRQVRHEEMTHLKADFEAKTLDEDSKFRAEESLQKLTDEFVETINSLGKAKEEELLTN
jgi:ribosome recycling factor